MWFWWIHKCVDLRWPAYSWICWKGKRELSKAQNNRADHQTPSQHENTHIQLHACTHASLQVCMRVYVTVHTYTQEFKTKHHFIHPPVYVFVHLRPEQWFPVSLHSLVYRERKLSPCRHKITGVETRFFLVFRLCFMVCKIFSVWNIKCKKSFSPFKENEKLNVKLQHMQYMWTIYKFHLVNHSKITESDLLWVLSAHLFFFFFYSRDRQTCRGSAVWMHKKAKTNQGHVSSPRDSIS